MDGAAERDVERGGAAREEVVFPGPEAAKLGEKLVCVERRRRGERIE
jgi:hypothetical protein